MGRDPHQTGKNEITVVIIVGIDLVSTNEDLAKSRGVSKRTYLLTKSIAKLNPEVQDIIEASDFDYSKTDLVALVRESDEVQLEVANLIATGACNTFKRSLQLARCKLHPFSWDEASQDLKDKIGTPFSVRKWTGESSEFSRLCKLVKLMLTSAESQNENGERLNVHWLHSILIILLISSTSTEGG